MTKKLYLMPHAPLEVESLVTAVGLDARGAWISLLETPFHPQGGGQPADSGSINGRKVIHVAHADGDVRHYVEDTADMDVGQHAVASVSPPSRLMNTRYHSAGHLLAPLAEQLLPDCRAVGGHHWPGQARIELNGPSAPLDSDIAAQLQAAAHNAIAADLPVCVLGDPFSGRGVRIGEWPTVPCGGTHVRRLSELSSVFVQNVKFKDGLIRISYTTSAPVF